MKDTPKVGTLVKTGNPGCCGSIFEKGAVGAVIAVDGLDSIEVMVPSVAFSQFHCRLCLEEVK